MAAARPRTTFPDNDDINLSPDATVAWFDGVVSLDNWRSQGRGPRYLRVGGRIAYRLRDLKAYRDAQTVEVSG